jgi:hypothetical protein
MSPTYMNPNTAACPHAQWHVGYTSWSYSLCPRLKDVEETVTYIKDGEKRLCNPYAASAPDTGLQLHAAWD